MTIDVIGIDIAKCTFQLHGADHSGKEVVKKRLSRPKLAAYVANLPICTIVMEACGGANYWARVFQRSGHTEKLISPQFVKPFVKTNKNDANDAHAIVKAASRPSMHYVPSKRGDRYLRTLLIHVARAMLSHCKTSGTPYAHWVSRKRATLSHNKAAVALANKNARIVWSMLNCGEEFNAGVQATAA